MIDQILVINSVLLWTVLIFNLLLTLALIRRQRTDSTSNKFGLEIGAPAPDFAADTLDGKRVTLSDYAGRSVVFIFIDPLCGPCRESIPGYESLRPKAATAGVELVLVSSGSTEKVRALVDEFNIRSQILLAPESADSIMKDFNLSGTPAYSLVGPDGTIQVSGRPMHQWADWKALTDSWETASARRKLETTVS